MSKDKPKGPKKYWPKWFYGPGYIAPAHSKPEPPEFARTFNSADEVPDGWVDHPVKLKIKDVPVSAAPVAASPPKAVTAKRQTKAEIAEETRQKYLAAARVKFGEVAVPANATTDELIEGLGGEAAALDAVKALNGNGI